MHNQDLKSLSISGAEYTSKSFVLGQSFARVPGVAFSGISTRNGDLLRLELRGVDLARVNTCMMFLISETIVEIQEKGVVVYD